MIPPRFTSGSTRRASPASPSFSPTVRCTAFSLIEVVIALGIVALSLVSMVGMIPVGLSTMRDAMDASTKALITQRIASEYMTTPFELIPDKITNKTYYFDQEGFQQNNADAATTRFQVTLSKQAADYPMQVADNPGAIAALNDSVTTLLLHMTFYGRNAANTNSVAAEVAISVPNQSGRAGTVNPTPSPQSL